MKILTYNVNGIRAAVTKGLLDWFKEENPDIICLQEIKALPENIAFEIEILKSMGYEYQYWNPAGKKGYSGVAVLSKYQPKNIEVGCGNELYDHEGRILRVDFQYFSLMSVYIPSGSSGDERQAIKYEFLDFFMDYIQQLKQRFPNLIIVGDYNICHRPIDIHNPKSNEKSSGFLPEERAWLEKFINSGFIDTFRYFNQEPHHYTWWSYRAKGARERNLGWRIDYQLVTESLKDRLKSCLILPEAKHSDHCPVLLDIDVK